MNRPFRRIAIALFLSAALGCASREAEERAAPADTGPVPVAERPESLSVHAGSLRSGETPMGWALRAGLDRNEAAEALAALAPYLPASRYRTDDRIEISRDEAGRLVRFAVIRRHKERFTAERSGGEWTARLDSPPLRKEILRYEGEIDGSLWESLRAEGAPAELVVRFAEIFSWTFDFLTDCRAGDRYAFLVEAFFDGCEAERFGDILVARYEGARGSVSGVLFEPEGIRSSYYAPDGTSLRKIFLRSPLNYRRISSGFTRSRYHPILKYHRPHLGIDYAAAKGTPVVTVGDGTVIFAGWSGGFGNYLEVRHTHSYATCYGHLAGFAKGIRKGSRVTQGQVIGYVGSTGLSTGPHLDFRMRRGKTYINPLSVDLPSADPVPADLLPDFYFVSRLHFAALDYFPNGSTEGREDFFTLAYRAGPSAGLIPGAGGAADHPIP